MKTTIDIADDLFARVQQLARSSDTTFRALTEEGLRLVVKNRENGVKKKMPPLVTVRGKGLSKEFRKASWTKISEACYGNLDI